jgi:hypothetical protein
MWMRKAIDNNEFSDCFLGVGRYISRDRYDPSPIAYKMNLLAFYDMVREDNDISKIKILEDFLVSICNDVEGIYIATNYIYLLIYHLNNGICDLPIDITRLVKVLSDAISDNLTALKNTNEIKRLFVERNVFGTIYRLNEVCFKDNGISFVNLENDESLCQLNAKDI